MKKIIIMQGVSGSGKSTWARAEAQRTGGLVVSADFWFEREGGYRFDPRQLSKAHAACFAAYVERLLAWRSQATGTLIVDNTNTAAHEIAPYMLAGCAFAPEAETFILRVPCDPEVAAARCVHDVPRAVIRSQHERIVRGVIDYLPTWQVRVLGKDVPS